jgi:hypothetical protein
MLKQVMIVLALLSVGLQGANSKEAAAANEDVPKGPTAAPPQQKPASSQSSSGSTSSGDKGAPSGGDVTGGTAKPAAPAKK